MISNKKLTIIKKEMLVVIFNYKDILGLYEDKNKNVVIFD
jgi:hypothetical protein